MEHEDRGSSSPRAGIRGAWDRLVGPGATRAETGLIVGYGLSFCAGLVVYVHAAGLDWSPLQLAVVALVAFDIAGGIVANTTDAGSRWWHRPSQTRGDQFRFVAAHVHPFALAWFFPAFAWTDAAVVYGVLVASAAAVLAVPDRLERPVAMGLFSIGLLVALYVIAAPSGLEWFVPFLYLKLIPGHLVRTPEVRGVRSAAGQT